jgi:PAS domain S-box-containing protein
MNPVSLADLVALLASASALVILMRGWPRALQREIKWLLLAILALMVFVNFSNFLEWSGVTVALDVLEENFRLLLPPLWVSLAYALAHEGIERGLRENERRYRTLLEEATDGIAIADAQGNYVEVNSKACEMMGYPRQELLRLNMKDLIPADNLAANPIHFDEMISGRTVATQRPLRRKDGSIVWAETTARRIEGGQIFSITRDITERRQAEEALRASEERYRTVVEDMPALVCRFHADGTLTFVNKHYAEYFGKPRDELEGRNFFQFIPEKDREGVQRHYATLTPQQPAVTYEHQVLAPDGSLRWQRWTDRALFDGRGRAVEYQSIGQDITESRQAEEALRESERQLRELLENVNLLAVGLDAHGNITFCNDFLLKLTGWRREEVIGQNWFDLFVPFLPDLKQSFDSLIRGEAVLPHYENEIATRASERRLINWNNTLLRDREGRVIGTTSIGEDITERRQAERILIEGKQRLSQALRAANAGAWEWNSKTNRAIWSEENYLVLGLPPGGGEASYDLWFQRIHPDDRALAERHVTQALEHKTDLDFEYRAVWPDGRVRWIRDMGKVKLDDSGQPAGMYGIQIDVTERKQAEEEREALIRELETKNAELERFTYTVSHDLKSPLITIRGFLGFLEKDAQSGDLDRLRADISRIAEATSRMQRLLDELLELSRIGRIVNPPEAVPFEAIAREAIELVGGQIAARRVKVDIAPDMPVVHGDRARLVEAVQNLVDNAVKFLGDQPEPRIEIGARPAGGGHVFFVRDNGIGIEPRFHGKVFGLFDKLNPESVGTGVGLALVKRIVEVHGGRIWVESEGAGTGAAFYFTLPAKINSV